MQQRVGLARALAVDPEILLMDEPFGALDEQTRRLLQEELLVIWEASRKTVIFITHSMEEAVLLGDRVALMSPRPGRILDLTHVPLPRPRASSSMRSRARPSSPRSRPGCGGRCARCRPSASQSRCRSPRHEHRRRRAAATIRPRLPRPPRLASVVPPADRPGGRHRHLGGRGPGLEPGLLPAAL